MEYQKKSYKLLILWFAFLFILLTSVNLIQVIYPDISTSIFIKILMMLLNVALLVLFYLIYKTESIYWINGMSYDKAKSMNSEQRKKYAWDHLIIFFQAFIVSFIYCIISYVLKFPMAIDIIIIPLVIVISAFRTVGIKV